MYTMRTHKRKWVVLTRDRHCSADDCDTVVQAGDRMLKVPGVTDAGCSQEETVRIVWYCAFCADDLLPSDDDRPDIWRGRYDEDSFP